MAIALAVVLRGQSLLFHIGLEPDEGVSQLQGRGILWGFLPYTLYFDNRQPLLYANFAVAQELFGTNLIAGRLWASVNVGVASALVALLALRFHGDRPGRRATVAAILVGVPVVSIQTGPVAVSELFVLPWTALAVWLAATAADARRPGVRLFLAGAALGVGSQVKLLALFEVAAIPAAFLAFRLRDGRPPTSAGRALRWIACASAGVALPIATIAAAYVRDGNWPAFRFAMFDFNAAYARAARVQWPDVATFALYLARILVMLAIPAAAAIALRRGPSRRGVWLGLLWASLALAGACATRRFFGHYLLETLPGLALVAGLGAGEISRIRNATLRRIAIAAAIVLPAGLFAIVGWRRAARDRESYRPRAEQVEAMLARFAAPGTLAYLGNLDPAFYFVSRAEPATFWVFPHWIGNGPWSKVSGFDGEAELDAILAKRPRLIAIDLRQATPLWDADHVARFFVRMRSERAYRQLADAEQPGPPGLASFVLEGVPAAARPMGR